MRLQEESTEGVRPETTRSAPECAQTTAQILETWLVCANKWIDEWIEDKGGVLQKAFPGGDRKPREAPGGPRRLGVWSSVPSAFFCWC